MISNIWTIEPAGDPGSAQALHSLGATSATLTRRNQAAATLRLSMRADSALTDALPAWESQWVLRRDGVVIFRGRVASTPRAGGQDEWATIEYRDAWWDLERTPYLQAWRTLTDSGTGQAVIARALLGRANNGSRQTTAEAIEQIISAAAAADTEIDLDIQALPELLIPEIESAGRTCGELLLSVLRWHPGAAAYVESGDDGDKLIVSERLMGDAASLTIGEPPLVSVDLRDRQDLVVDSVHVHYETEAPHYYEKELEDGVIDQRIRRSLLAFSDIYPPDSTPTRRSMVVVLPGPPLNSGAIGASAISYPPQPHRIPIKTRILPETGRSDEVAERWWLDHLGLSSLGLTVDDIVLPPSDSIAAQPHRVRFAWELGDENDPLQDAPSAVNPESTPLWRPPSVNDLPRELVSGQLAEWMDVRAAQVVCDATVGVRKSTVDALPARAIKTFMALGPTEGKVGGVDAYLLHREVRVIGTNARTRVYSASPGVGLGTPSESQAAAVEAAMEEARIPDLAERLYQERSVVPWEGSVSLAEEEAGASRWIGLAINILGGRAEWETMRALVQSESLDLARGTTNLEIGPPEHLSPQDHRELFMAARRTREEQATSRVISPPPAASPGEIEDEDDDDLGAGGVFPPTVAPVAEVGLNGSTELRPWDLVETGDGTYRLYSPRVYKSRTDIEEMVSILGNEFEPAEGWLVAEIVDLDPASIEIKLLETWSGFPSAYEFSGTSFDFEAARIPLWKFASSIEEGAVAIADGLWGVKVAPSHHLRLIESLVQVPGETINRAVPDLI